MNDDETVNDADIDAAGEALKKHRHIINSAITAFDAALTAEGLAPDVRAATIGYYAQELAFASVAALSCCEDGYSKKMCNMGLMLYQDAVRRSMDLTPFRRAQRAMGKTPIPRCLTFAGPKPGSLPN